MRADSFGALCALHPWATRSLFSAQFRDSLQTQRRVKRKTAVPCDEHAPFLRPQSPTVTEAHHTCVPCCSIRLSCDHLATLVYRHFPFSPHRSQAPRATERLRPAARRSSASLIAPVQVLVPPASRAPSKKADLGTWEQPHARALRVVCLERLRASKGEIPCSTIQ